MTGWDADLQAAVDRQVAELWAGVAPGPDATALHTALTDAVAGGKRLRPRLVVDAHDALGGYRHDAVVRAAAAVELLHTAFVVHDDLIDGDDVRRGRPSVPGRFRAAGAGSSTYAVAGSVLTGDLALTAALTAFARLDVPADTRARLLDLATHALTTSAVGELADVRLSLGSPAVTSEEVVELAYRKTAAYSFVLPLQVGAVLADADADVVAALGDAGRSLGIAFQLRDDLAGMFGDADVTGKDPAADLREGKLTLLVCQARGTSAWPCLERHWGDPTVTTADLDAVRRALEESGTRAAVEAVAAEHLRAGTALAARFGVGAPAVAA